MSFNGWRWQVNNPTNPCKHCQERDGQLFPLSRPFRPLHPGCVCSPELAYVESPEYASSDNFPESIGELEMPGISFVQEVPDLQPFQIPSSELAPPFPIGKMALEDMTPQLLADAPDEEIISAWHRLSQWYADAIRDGRATENILNAAVFVMDAARFRGIGIDPEKPLARAAHDLKIAKGIPDKLVMALNCHPSELVLVKNFISVVGSALDNEYPGDLDILIRASAQDRNLLLQAENVILPLRKVLDPDKTGRVHFIDNPQGPHSDNIPLYSLVLRREEPEKQIVKDAGVLGSFQPQKPSRSGTTEFFDASGLWPWVESRLKDGAVLYGEVKVDGFRATVRKIGRNISIWFEDYGEDRARDLEDLVRELEGIDHDLVMDGELLAVSHGHVVPRTQIFDLLKGEPAFEPRYVAFDLLCLDGDDLADLPLQERQSRLKKLLGASSGPIRLIEPRGPITSRRGLEIVGRWAASQEGSEGLMVKDVTRPYTFGESEDWAKLKTVVELKVIVQDVWKAEHGFVYSCALKDQHLGKTFITGIEARPGQVINVRIEELLILEDGRVAWGKPSVVGPDSAQEPDSLREAIEKAWKAHVLKAEVKKTDLICQDSADSTYKNPSLLAFVGASPGEIEAARGQSLVGPVGRAFRQEYITPLGIGIDQVACLYQVPVLLRDESGSPRGPTDMELSRWQSDLLERLHKLHPAFVIALSQRIGKELEGVAAFTMPHPETIRRGGKSTEVRRKVRQISQLLKSGDLEVMRDETRTSIAARFYEDHWFEMMPRIRARFVYQHHWRGLTEEETHLSEEELLKTGHSVHGDLRFEIDGRQLWGFTVFEGTAQAILSAAGSRLAALPHDDSLQGAWKLIQPHAWLEIASEKPFVTSPGGPGATSERFSKFFEIESGEYELTFARQHGREIYLHGSRLKGRFLIQYAPMGDRRVWLISRPESQESYVKTNTLDEVAQELRAKDQTRLIWSLGPGSKPRLIDVNSTQDHNLENRHASIFKADEEKRIVYGVVLEPETEDSQGDVISAGEIEQAAHRFLVESRVIGNRHRGPAEAELVESWIVPDDIEFEGQHVLKGSWVAAVHVSDDNLWEKIKSGEYTGFSVGGWGERA